MSDLRELPDDAMVPMRWVREHFVPRASGNKRDMTTVELSKHRCNGGTGPRHTLPESPPARLTGHLPRHPAHPFAHRMAA